MIRQTYVANHLVAQNSYQRTLHFHDSNEIFFSLNDACSFFLGDQLYKIGRGVLILIPEGTIHRKFNPTNLAVNTYTIHYPSALLETCSTPGTDLTLLYGATAACVQLPREEIERAIGLFEACLLPSDGSFGSDMRRNMRFLELLLEFHPFFTAPEAASHDRSEASELVSQLIAYIGEHLTERLSLDRLAGEFFVSKYNLCRQFKKETGFTVVEYVNSSRIRMACSILRREKKSNNVGERVGFANPSHFIHTFQQYTGMTPRSYVNQYREFTNAPIFNNFSPHREELD